ncbi:cytochrome b/b6 domain-containing protein [Octadecabacter sp. CECT 8868]|uniref:cytochrome b/b6 domain-containing protein n=1 Tax=Octadecabacter algicola TaxID=2909342 RepID=UPI001F43EF4B|nr:cytochrome b/b6 domain-containing protein [Octadecabacter algicola]MCF2905006.1 cytochrome b/b6 domain-containing protein [Octadecabacter algicola]
MFANTATRYGSIARFFHWAIALLVLVDIALGVLGKFIPRTGDTVDVLQILYSTHKTIGVTVLLLAVLRVAWAFSQPRPTPLHPTRAVETFAAETAHWVLYASIFVLPLSGWVMHSAEVGFAPIWWPFGQNLPFVPKSEDLAHTAANVHWAAGIVLAATVAAHIGGALKHSMVDRDATLARMWRGTDAGDPKFGGAAHRAPAGVALLIWGVTLGGALTVFAPSNHDEATLQTPSTQTGGWVVQDGTISITVMQIGAPVTGTFANWQAEIEYDTDSGTGAVNALIETASVTLGSVTDQAKGPEFFDVQTFGQATFAGDITQVDGGAHTVVGTLTLVGQTLPVTLDFDLVIADGVAEMSGTTTLDRRDFGMGAAYPDETSVGFSVEVLIVLTAAQPD